MSEKIGIQIGGVVGKRGAEIVAALRRALDEAIRRGQNEVAKAIAAELAKLGGATNTVVTGTHVEMK